MNKPTHFFISHTRFSRKGWCFCGVWEMGGETHTYREDFFFPYILPGVREYQRLYPLARSSETPLVGCVSLARLRFSAHCLNLTVWFSSRDLLPVIHLFDLSALIVLSCLLIKMCQLAKHTGSLRMNRKSMTHTHTHTHNICLVYYYSKIVVKW